MFRPDGETGAKFRAMENMELVQVRKLLSQGKKVYIGRDAAGRHKLKFKTGPFGVLTRRYTVDFNTMEKLRDEYHLDRD
jgi:hypothetical protein